MMPLLSAKNACLLTCSLWAVTTLPASPFRGDILSNLLEKNPFGGAATRGTTSTTPAAAPLELRGVVAEGGAYWFNLYDPATKKGAWVQKGESLAQYVVKGFDLAEEVLTLEQSGRDIKLAMQESRSSTGKMSTSPGPALAKAKPSAGPSSPATAVAAPASEQRRLEQVAAEINARRKERLQRHQTARGS